MSKNILCSSREEASRHILDAIMKEPINVSIRRLGGYFLLTLWRDDIEPTCP